MDRASDKLKVKQDHRSMQKMRKIAARLKALQKISVELTHLQEPPALLYSILRNAMDLLCCDAGSLFLLKDETHLSIEVALNDTIDFQFRKVKIPLERPAVATKAFKLAAPVCIKDVYEIPRNVKEVFFDASWDREMGYRTRSVLALPLKNSKGEVLGVLQLLNKKNSSKSRWPVNSEARIGKMPFFDRSDLELMESFAAVAGANLESQGLYKQIENIFESFVKASVVAIDARDPGTKGHSVRVAQLAEALAREISNSEDPEMLPYRLSEDELKELLWAGYVHDFGKIAVRESVLQKDQKLTEVQRLRIQGRIHDFVLSAHSSSPQLRSKLEKHWNNILDLSRPSVMDLDAGRRLEELSRLSYLNSMGEWQKLLTDEDVESLNIKRGCLTAGEREEIEAHVVQSYEFLRQIPWGAKLRRIPEIAYSHHELMDGTGYPRRLKGEEIPPQSRIMTICDVFDALSASDRAYKSALPLDKTLSILENMVSTGKLDARFFKIFKDREVWKMVAHKTSSDALVGNSKIAA